MDHAYGGCEVKSTVYDGVASKEKETVVEGNDSVASNQADVDGYHAHQTVWEPKLETSSKHGEGDQHCVCKVARTEMLGLEAC